MYKIIYIDENDKLEKEVLVPGVDDWTANYNFRMGQFNGSSGSMWVHTIVSVEDMK